MEINNQIVAGRKYTKKRGVKLKIYETNEVGGGGEGIKNGNFKK